VLDLGVQEPGCVVSSTYLVQRAREHVQAVSIGAQLRGHPLVVLDCLAHERRGVLRNILPRVSPRNRASSTSKIPKYPTTSVAKEQSIVKQSNP